MEACYARCGDRERRLNTNRHEAGRRNGRDRAVEDHRAGHLAYDAQDPRGHFHREGHQVACFDDSLEALRFLSSMALPTCSFSAWISLKWTVSKC